MDKINKSFQEYLSNKNLNLKILELKEEWQYKGKILVNKNTTVEFGIQIEKSDEESICQIVFKELIKYTGTYDKNKVLSAINKINQSNGIFYNYYFQDNAIFSRSIILISTDIDLLFSIFKAGMNLTKSFYTLAKQLEIYEANID